MWSRRQNIQELTENVNRTGKSLCAVTTRSLKNNQINLCEKYLSETDLYSIMKNMQMNKSINDGLTREFYERFWDEIKKLFIASVTGAKTKCELSISQRQAIIKLIEQKIEAEDTPKIGNTFHY